MLVYELCAVNDIDISLLNLSLFSSQIEFILLADPSIFELLLQWFVLEGRILDSLIAVLPRLVLSFSSFSLKSIQANHQD